MAASLSNTARVMALLMAMATSVLAAEGPLTAAQIMEKYPDDPRGYIYAANEAMAKCELANSERHIREALERAAKNPKFAGDKELRVSMQRMLASLLGMSQQFDKALTVNTQLVDSNPADIQFLYMRAQTYVQLDKLDNALSDSERIIEIDKTYFKAWQIRAFTLYRLKRFEDAAISFTTIIENSDDPPPILWGMRGQSYAALGQYGRAAADYDAALKLAQEWREQLNSDDIVEQELRLKKSNAETARLAEAASPQDAARIRAELFDTDQRSLLPTNSLRCQ